MGRFRSSGQVQKYLAAHDQIAVLSRPKRHHLSASTYRHARTDAFGILQNYTRELNA